MLVGGGALATGTPFSAPGRATADNLAPWLNRRQSADRRAAELLAAMSLEQKLTLVAGGGAGIPALGVPPLRFTDGPNGIGDGATRVTAFPAAIDVAASWDRSLAGSYGQALGAEAAGKGNTLLAAPTINVVRTPRWGRTAETFGEDPFLAGQLAAPEIRGIQAHHVIAEVKHFVGYDQEVDRYGEPLAATPVSDRVSERALQEIYFPPFKAAVQQGGAASVMCSYNRINGVQSCQDRTTLSVLKHWGLQGFVGPDATLAVHNDVAAANAGVDNFLLGSFSSAFAKRPEQSTLTAAVQADRISGSRLDGMARRILLAMFGVGLFGHAPRGGASSDVSTLAHRRLATRIAEEGAVLLKNSRHVLPLTRSTSLAVIGPDATSSAMIEEHGSSAVLPSAPVITPLAAIRAHAGGSAMISYSPGTLGTIPLPSIPSSVLRPASGFGSGLSASYFSGPVMTGTRTVTRIDPTIDALNGFAPPPPLSAASVHSARWTGTLVPPVTGLYRFSLTVAGTSALYIRGHLIVSGDAQFSGAGDGTPSTDTITFQGTVKLVRGRPVPIRVDYSIGAALGPASLQLGWEAPATNLLSRAVAAARRAHVAIVFANDITSEGMDRPSLGLPGDQDRLIEAVAAANPRTVVVLETAGPVLMPWLAQVAGVLEEWYPGQSGGPATAASLYGDVDPSGRLPLTFPANAHEGPATQRRAYPGIDNVADYGEGIDVGYRYYDQYKQAPLFPFGYGLSYTSFSLSDLAVRRSADTSYNVRVSVNNTGSRRGTEVVELYVSYPRQAAEPPHQLKGFVTVQLAAGQHRTVALTLSRTSLAVWSPHRRVWSVVPGRYQVLVGSSSRDLPLRESIKLP